MRSKVQLSKYAFILTLIINVILMICCVTLINEKPTFWFVVAIWFIFLVCGLLFGPTEIIADKDYVTIKSCLRKHKISVRDIQSIELFQPSMGAYRLFASGGYFGYWGLFREGDVGKYTAYYGKASDCFLIRIKNGDRYVLGCIHPEEMVGYIQRQK